MNARIKLVKGDITKIKVDVVVNAANKTLLGGGGVDGAIHRAAGPELLKECRKLGGCEVGRAKITDGYNLPATYVIHTVGPVWNGGNHKEAGLLADCYINSLRLARMKKVKSVAFPNISTGVYRFPKEKAAKVAIKAVSEYLENYIYPKEVLFVCFNEENFTIYKKLLKY